MKLKIPISVYFVIYYLLLLWLYHYKIITYFYWDNIALMQEANFELSGKNIAISIAIFILNLVCLSTLKKTRFAFITLSIFFTLLTIPSLIAYSSAQMYPLELLGYHQLLFFSFFFFSFIKIDFSRFPVLNKKQALYLLLLITTIGVVPYLLIYGPHINLKNLLFLDVYQTRSTMGSLSNPYFGYTYSLFTKIIIPLIIVFSLELKNKVLALVGVLYLILFYLFGAHKTVYVGLILVLVLYRWSYSQTVKKILKYSSLLIVFCLILAQLGYDYPWILSFRRVHFLPTLLDITYLDFFDGKPLYWSESVLKQFFDYPYSMRHENLIGKVYFNRPDMAANNGLISDGFMNLGAWGVMINVFIVSGYFMILNSLNIPSKYFGLYVLLIFSFLSSSLSIVLLTHGALMVLLISIFLLNQKN